MKWLFYVLGILLAAFGVLWILQGTNVIQGGVMGGHIQYALLGLVALAIGIVLLVAGSRRGKVAGVGS